MDRIVKIEVRDVFGNTRYYPMNMAAQFFADIAGTKTIDPTHLPRIRALGFKIEPVQKPLPKGITNWKEIPA